ncbi:MAG TPA: DEAD/DEAH box helicase, partial [Candidatus Ozemobacteraceae bacterium]
MSSTEETVVRFADLGLHPQVLRSLEDVGYENPTPIQARIIPLILSGRDVLGQAQTGTGKTAAFALPLLSKLDLSVCLPQILVLAPTRELAGQVAEAFAKYGAHLPDLRVVPIYGGQEYGPQLRQLARGAHVVIGTPGRVIDHIERGTLILEKLFGLVLDEADEMLKMGFKEDVERILQETPGRRQSALFSATLPGAIRTLAKTYMSEPEEVTIKSRTTTVETTRQRYWLVSRYHKLDALSRIIEMEPFDAMLIFVRTKIETIELSEQLAARGFASVPLNGDIPQNQRERTVEQLRSGKVNIVIATDVAARGLDVDRISHVINYDLPYDTESYIHRIGRTGRAGRSGEAILFVAPRERHLLRVIEQATRQKIELLELPTIEAINEKRISGFKKRIAATLNGEAWNAYLPIVTEFSKEAGVPPLEVAAALALMSQNGRSFLLTAKAEEESATEAFEKASRLKEERRKRLAEGKEYREIRAASAELLGKPERHRRERPTEERKPRIHRDNEEVEPGMTRYRIEVGRRHMVKPGQIVGAIAGETGIDSSHIGRIVLHDEFSTVDLPEDVFASSFGILSKTWVAGQRLRISRFD